jgi:hypothetical protein
MNTYKKLWKVVQTHKMGAQAPAFFVETEYVSVKSKSTRENKEVEELQALEKAKKLTRLADFPNVWTIRVEHQENKYWNSKRNKWWSTEQGENSK